jgi:hypothetical protein
MQQYVACNMQHVVQQASTRRMHTQHTAYSIQHTAYNIQQTSHNTIHNTQHTTHNTQHTTHNIQCTKHNIQCTKHNAQHTTYNTQCRHKISYAASPGKCGKLPSSVKPKSLQGECCTITSYFTEHRPNAVETSTHARTHAGTHAYIRSRLRTDCTTHLLRSARGNRGGSALQCSRG